jgi:uncharacterized protein YndB with AHSA1/START domain
MRSFELAIAIEAPPDALWRAITAVAQYPKWNPVIRRVDGVFAPGNRLRCQLSLGGRTRPFVCRFVALTPPVRVTFSKVFLARWLFTVEHHLEVLPFKANLSVFQQRWVARGALAFALWPRLRRRLPQFKPMNLALRDQLEGR